MTDLAAGGMTMVVVTHEMAFARNVADRVVFMHEGRIAEDATAKDFFENPQHERTKQFIARSVGRRRNPEPVPEVQWIQVWATWDWMASASSSSGAAWRSRAAPSRGMLTVRVPA